MRNNRILIFKKKNFLRKLQEALHLIDIGNQKIADTFETLAPTLTYAEIKAIYKKTKEIMYTQVDLYQELISEKEEINGCR